MAPTQRPKPGDLIEIYRGLYQHWAIYIGDGLVIHLASEGSHIGYCSAVSVPTDIAVVKMEKLRDVVGNNKYNINNLLDHTYKPRDINEIIKDAKDWVGEKVSYSVASKNCEHFVTELRYGKSKSLQVQKVQMAVETGGVLAAVGGIAAVIGTFVSMLVRSKN